MKESIRTSALAQILKIWKKVASGMSLDLVRAISICAHFKLGGGFKVARMKNEMATDLQRIGHQSKSFSRFCKRPDRELKLEVEPGTFLVAHACSLVCSFKTLPKPETMDIVFLKLDGGMTEILRPSLYGAQHPIHIVPEPGQRPMSEETETGYSRSLL